MPLYDYRCLACGHEVEVIHSIDGAGPATCEVCGGAMRKAMSTPAIHFKGSGWAKKDYQAATKAKAKAEKAGEVSGTTGGDKSDAASKGGDSDGSAKASTGDTETRSAPKETSKDAAAPSPKAASKATD